MASEGRTLRGSRGRSRNGRRLFALAVSVAWHLVLFTAVLWQVSPEYRFPPPTATPAPTAPTMEAEIVTLARLEPPKVVPQTAPPEPAPPPPPLPTPPKPEPQPQPQATPAPAKAPEKPPEPAKPTPPKPSALPAPAPTPPAPAPRPAPAPQAAPAPPVKPAPAAAPSRPSPLNIHRAAQAPPANVPTLPMAPAAGAPAKAGGGAAQPGAPAGSASRLQGLSPYPYGAMPSGGPGLRGTLVGCANADAVNLSPVERAHCNERFGEDMSHAPTLDPISRTKRAGFDKAAGREDAERRYRAAEPHALGAPFGDGGYIPHGPAGPGGPPPDDGQYPPR